MRLVDVQMSVTDARQAARFYEQTLGLTVVRDGDRTRVGVGASSLTLRPGAGGHGSHHVAITVPVAGFDRAKAWLSRRVPLLLRDGADEFALPAPWRSRSVYFTGPDDVLLELIARHDLGGPGAGGGTGPRADARPTLVSISEVGVAVDDVGAAVGAVQEAYGLQRFDSGGPGFAPVGDHHGLLVLVDHGRTWFPTVDLVPSDDPLIISLDAGPRASRTPLVLGRSTLLAGSG